MRAKTLLLSLSACSLVATAAYAQRTWPPHVDMPAGAPLGVAQPTVNDGTTLADLAAARMAEAVAATVSAADASAAADVPPELNTGWPYVVTPASGAVSARLPGSDGVVEAVKSGVVRDTAESRRRYPPLSAAGRRTGAVGD